MPSSQRWALALLLVVASTAVAVLGQLTFDRVVGRSPAFLIPFLFPVVAAALYGGTRWGLFATALSTVIVVYSFTPPEYSLVIRGFDDRVRVGTFVVLGAVLSALTGRLRRYRQRAEESARTMVRRNDELERQVAERREAERLLEQRVSERTAEIAAQNRLLDAVLDALPVAVIIADPAGGFVRVNRASYDVCGAVPQAAGIEDYPAWVGYWPGTERRVEPMEWPLSRAVFGGESCTDQIEIERFGDRARRTLQISAAPVRGPDGTVIAGVVAGVDVTEQKRVADALRDSERKFRAVFHSQFQFIGLMSPDGVVLEANRTALAAAGVPECAVLGKPFWETAWWTHDPAQQDRLREAVRRAAAGQVDRFEASHPRADGTLMWVDFSLTPYRHDGRVVLLIPEGRDITERKAVEDAVRESEAFARTVLDALPAHIAVVDRAGTITAVNRAWERFADENPGTTGVGSRTGVGYLAVCDNSAAIGCEDARAAAAVIRGVLAGGGETVGLEYPCHAPDEQRWFSMSVTPLSTSAGGAVISHTNITSRKLAEGELGASEERFRLAAEAAGVGVWEWNVLTNRIYWNDQMFRIYNVAPTPDGVVPYETWSGAVLAEDLARQEESLRDTVQRGGGGRRAFRIRWPDGQCRFIEAAEQVRANADKRAEWVVGTNLDVTARRQAEAAVRESEEQFRSAFDYAPIGMALVAPEGKWLRVNRSLCEMIGYAETELLATDFQTITHPDDLDADLGLVRQVLAGTLPAYQMEKRYVHKRGHVVHVLLSVSLVRDGRGSPLHFISQIKDITQRKETERALAAHDALLRQFIKHSPAAIAMFDREVRYLQASDRWLTDYHLDGRDIIGLSHYEVFPDVPDHWKAIHRRVLAGAVEGCAEDPFHRADGSTEWLQWECRPWHTAGGGVGGLIMFTQVITGRKRAEAALRGSEERFRVLFEQSSDAHLIFSEGDGILDCNPAAVAMLRCPDKRALLRLHPAELSPDLQPDGRRSLEKCVEMDATARRNGYHRFDWDHRRLDGEVFPCEVTLTPVTLDGRAALLVVWHELTERKRAEEALRASEEQYRTVVEALAEGVVLQDQTGAIVASNRRASEILGLSEDQIAGRTSLDPRWQSIREDGSPFPGGEHPAMVALRTGRPSYNTVMGVRRPAGDLNWMTVNAVPFERATGGPAVVASFHDITARKQAEAALRLSEERFRRLVDGVADHGIFMLDMDGRVVSWNPGAEQIKGYSAEEILGRHFSVFYTPAAVSVGHPQQELTAAVANGRYHEEGERVRKDGSRFWAAVTISALRDDTGRHVGFVKFTHDITQRKRSEELILASLKEKEVLLKEIHHRVKNNLQIVSALLELQSEHTADPTTLGMFQESRGRVKSMALIHERLYRSQDMARVDFAEYVRQLAEDLYRTYKVSDDDIRLELDVDIPPVPIDIAIPCGLLLNELMSNCFKHAFKDAATGCIRVALHRDGDDTNVLAVSDDGAGFPAGTDFRNTASFGLQLVGTLVSQLDGEVELTTVGGTTFTVRFPRIKK